LLYDRNLQRKTNQTARKVTYEVLDDRNLQTKQNKKHVSPSSLAKFYLTDYLLNRLLHNKRLLDLFCVFGSLCRNKS